MIVKHIKWIVKSWPLTLTFPIYLVSIMDEVIFMVKESDEGGYQASALGHAIFTEADSWDELKENVNDAVICHFDDQTGLIFFVSP